MRGASPFCCKTKTWYEHKSKQHNGSFKRNWQNTKPNKWNVCRVATTAPFLDISIKASRVLWLGIVCIRYDLAFVRWFFPFCWMDAKQPTAFQLVPTGHPSAYLYMLSVFVYATQSTNHNQYKYNIVIVFIFVFVALISFRRRCLGLCVAAQLFCLVLFWAQRYVGFSCGFAWMVARTLLSFSLFWIGGPFFLSSDIYAEQWDGVTHTTREYVRLRT